MASYLNDHTWKMMAETLVRNNRLQYYEEILRYAHEHGYEVISLEKFFALDDRRCGKHLILRHDVDWNGVSTKKMYETEKKWNVDATYYFRFTTIDNELINSMKADGFDVGLHFETIADHIKENKITDAAEIDLEEMRLRFVEDVRRFEQIVGFKINSCCSHGDRANVDLGISNNVITEDCDMSRFGLLFEAYDQAMYKNDIDCHVMDCAVTAHYGYAYADTPIKAMQEGRQNILFLSHPNHWWLNGIDRIKRMRTIICGKAKCSVSTREFARIAQH